MAYKEAGFLVLAAHDYICNRLPAYRKYRNVSFELTDTAIKFEMVGLLVQSIIETIEGFVRNGTIGITTTDKKSQVVCHSDIKILTSLSLV